jgi:hypothetical protein
MVVSSKSGVRRRLTHCSWFPLCLSDSFFSCSAFHRRVDALQTCSGLQDRPSRIEQSGKVLSVSISSPSLQRLVFLPQPVSGASKNKTLLASFRTIFEQHRPSQPCVGHGSPIFERDIQNAVLFMRSQREYKVLPTSTMCRRNSRP